MNRLTDKHIWDSVFSGNVQRASQWTQKFRDAHAKPEQFIYADLEPLALYLEPSLVSNNGHQSTLATCYIQALAKLGYRTRIIHSLRNSLPLKDDWVPYFLVKHHTMASQNIDTPSDLNYVENYFLSEFEDIISLSNPRVCIFATIRFTNVVAAAKAIISSNIQNIIFGLMEAAKVPDCKDSEIVKSAFSRAATMLQEQQTPHLFIAETEHVRDFLLDCGFRESNVKVFPYVAAKMITDLQRVSNKSATNKIRVGYLGGSRSVRHPEIIADLIVLESLSKSVEFCTQLDLNYIKIKRSKDVCQKISALHEGGAIQLYPPNLSSLEYRSLFCSLDFIVLPYGERYQQIGSGIFFEAISAGVTPILPVGSKMQKMYVSLGGNAPVFQYLSAVSIADAIFEGTLHNSLHKKTASAIRAKWHQHPYSADQWQSELSKWLPSV